MRINAPKRSNLSDEDFLRWMSSIGGTPPELLANPEVMKLFLPALKADLHVVENYGLADNFVNNFVCFNQIFVVLATSRLVEFSCRCDKPESPLLSCPVTCFDGKSDIPHDLQGQCFTNNIITIYLVSNLAEMFDDQSWIVSLDCFKSFWHFTTEWFRTRMKRPKFKKKKRFLR